MSECLSCGACCLPSDQSDFRYVVLESGDKARLPKGISIGLDKQGNECLGTSIRRVENQPVRMCLALSGTPFQKVCCSIYPVAPRRCKSFAEGSPECRTAQDAVRRFLANGS